MIWRARTTFWQMIARRLDKSALAVPARQSHITIFEALKESKPCLKETSSLLSTTMAGIRDALEQLLTAQGHCVELYSCGEEFIRAATFSAATCLLVDIGYISGMELGRHLAASGFMFPIIFMTGSQDELTRTQAVKFGCVAYLQKPLKAAELNEAISLAIGKSVRK